MSDPKTCPNCTHFFHRPGYCDNCNCGEDEWIRPRGSGIRGLVSLISLPVINDSVGSYSLADAIRSEEKHK